MSDPSTTDIVAIVDDDEAIRSALGRLIRTIGYQPRTFASAEELLSRIDDLRPACVLSDIQMPGMNGLELAHTLRRAWPDLPNKINKWRVPGSAKEASNGDL